MNKNLQLNLSCVILILLAVVLGCSDSGGGETTKETVKKSVPPEYVGMWAGQDGSRMTFRNDWSGDYKSGGKSVSGGSFEIDEAAKEIRFSFMGFDAGKYKIDEPPKRNRMKLDGMEYRRTDSFASEDKTDSNAEKNGTPLTDAELSAIAGETIRNLDRAIQQSDFSEFMTTVSERLREKYTADDFERAFDSKIRQKEKYRLKNGAPLTFTTKPILQNEGNTFEVEGTYPTTISGGDVPFELTYVKENDEWKLLGVYLNPINPPSSKK